MILNFGVVEGKTGPEVIIFGEVLAECLFTTFLIYFVLFEYLDKRVKFFNK